MLPDKDQKIILRFAHLFLMYVLTYKWKFLFDPFPEINFTPDNSGNDSFIIHRCTVKKHGLPIIEPRERFRSWSIIFASCVA